MSNLGTTTVGSFYYFDATGNSQFYNQYTMPSPGGTITDLYVNAGGYNNGSTVARLCVWWGNVLQYASGNITLPNGGANGSGNAWQHVSGLSLYVPSGTVVQIGFWYGSASAGGVIWTSGAQNAVGYESGHAAPGNFGSPGSITGQAGPLGAYVVYTPLSAPTISSTSPTVAVPSQSLTITGTGFLHASAVTIGGVSQSFTINSDTQITISAVASNTPGGSQTLAVTNPAGTGNYTLTVGGIAWVNTGTPASPVWTQGVVYVNTGTPASPVWTVASGVPVNTGTSGSPVWTNGG